MGGRTSPFSSVRIMNHLYAIARKLNSHQNFSTSNKNRTYLRVPSWITKVALAGTTLGMLWVPSKALAEGSYQLELRDETNSVPTQFQGLLEYDSTYSGASSSGITQKDRPLYVDVQAGEVINVSACGRGNADSVEVEIYYHPPGTFNEFTTLPPLGTKVADTGSVGNNISCTSDMNGVITNPLVRYDSDSAAGGQGAGTYEIRLFNTSQNGNNGTLNRFDITLTPDTATDPDPRLNQGRLWTYVWGFRGNSFNSASAADTNYYVPVPGGFPNTNFVWQLDLNNFAGFAYEIIANELGVDSPNAAGNNVAGLSVPISGNSATPQYKVYLSYPTLNIGPPPAQSPVISNLRFEDSAGVDFTFSPTATPGVQDTGFFKFTSNVDGTYGIIIDTDDGNGNGPDGVYGPGDVLLLGTTQANAETSVEWDGKDANGNTLPVGNYSAQVQARLGEYHFVATDAETSGGGAQNGLTIFRASSNTNTSNTLVYWDDITGLGNPAGATTTLPNGALSNTPAGKHTWGNFSSGGFGNLRHIDTYVFGNSSSSTTPLVIETTDTPVTNNPNVLLVKRITRVNGLTTNGSTNLNVYVDDPNYPYDDNTLDSPEPTPLDTEYWPTPSTYLLGATNGGETRPGDEIEYTIYFLSTGDKAAVDVQLCDKVPSFQTFIPDAYNSVTPAPSGGVGANRGIAVEYNGTPLSYTNDADGDTAQYYPPGSTLPAACDNAPAQAEDNGAVVINLGNLPESTAPGTPTTSYGALKFRAKVK